MIKILEYDQVDPLQAMYLSKLALDFALTPELVAHIRQTDPRPFPCLAVYAMENDAVIGQVGVFRLPMMSTEGRQDIGGIWAVSTHPQYTRRGIASRLIEEAHTRMREAGLNFSSLGTNRYRVTYNLYRQHGYVETNVWAITLTHWYTAHQPTRLRAEPPGSGGYDLVEQIYCDIARDYLGFAWRYTPFARLRLVDLEDIWILRENNRIVGYALTHHDQTMLTISNIILEQGIDIAEAIAAVTAEVRSGYVQVTVSRPIEVDCLRQAGYHIAHPSWDGFMIAPLIPQVSYEDARRLFGIGTDRFLISWLDVT